jgi:hypothetical protein
LHNTVHSFILSHSTWFVFILIHDLLSMPTMPSMERHTYKYTLYFIYWCTHFLFYHFFYSIQSRNSCVADNSLGRTKKYIEVSGRPGPTEFLSSQYSSHLDRYNLTFKIESLPDLDEIKLLYRKLMVHSLVLLMAIWNFSILAYITWREDMYLIDENGNEAEIFMLNYDN